VGVDDVGNFVSF
jgi:hypothetical protein